MPRITSILRGMFPLAFVLLLAGCLETAGPLTDATTAKSDPALVGVWRNKADPNDYVFVGVTKDDDCPGLMTYINATFDKSNNKIALSGEFSFTISTLKGNQFANVLSVGMPSSFTSYKSWKETDKRSCTIMRYEVTGTTLSVWEANDDAIKNMVEIVQADSGKDTASVVRVIEAGRTNELFLDSGKKTYVKATQ